MSNHTEQGRARVFVSYSRRDSAFTDELVISLGSHGFEVMFDRDDLFPGEQFEPRLRSLISESDTTVAVVSPDWLGSEWCRREYEIAHGLGRRILPLIIAPVDPSTMPGDMGRVQFIQVFGPGRSFARGMADLVTALRTDIGWVREQTRLLARAEEWEHAARSPALLLRGEALDRAKAWIDGPAPNHVGILPQVAEFIAASDDNARQQQRSRLLRRVWIGATSALALIGVLGTVTLSLQLRNAQLRQEVQTAESAKEAVVQLAAYDAQHEAAVAGGDAAPDPAAVNPAPDAAPSEGPPPTGPRTEAPGDLSAASRLVADLNSPNKATRLESGAEVAAAVRARDNAAMIEALVTALEPPAAAGLTSTGRFNTLYMMNVFPDWHGSPWADRLGSALTHIDGQPGIGPQTQDCIDKLTAKLRGAAAVADVCGNIRNYGLDPAG